MSDFEDNIRFGVIWDQGRVYWMLEDGWFVSWPEWFKRVIVDTWAWFSCRVWGHEALGFMLIEDEDDEGGFDPYCMHCNKKVL